MDNGPIPASQVIVTSPNDLQLRSTLDEHRNRFRGDWLATACLVASAAEQVARRCDSGESFENLTMQSIAIDQLGRPVLAESSSRPSASHDISHLPPEQLDGEQATAVATSHVYSIGVIFYSLLCGRPPFASADPSELRRQIIDDLPQPPRQLAHSVPKEVEDICLKTLEKRKADRYATPQKFAADLRKQIAIAEEETLDSISTVVTRPLKTSVAQRLLAVIICEFFGEGRDSESEECASFVRSVMTDHLGGDRVRVIGDRILIDSRQGEDEPVARMLSDILQSMSAVKDRISSQGERTSVDMKVRLASSTAAFGDVQLEKVEFTSTGLHARIDGEAIQLIADSRETLRRWLDLQGTNCTESVQLPVIQESALTDLEIAPTKFVGQQSQLGILRSRWTQSLEGLGQVVLLIGDAGSGKSRLLSEFAARLSPDQEIKWIHVRCRPVSRGIAFASLSETYRELALPAELSAEGNSQAKSTASKKTVKSSTLDSLSQLSVLRTAEDAGFSGAEKVCFAEGMRDWLQTMAKASPVLFSVEDIQWADPATLDFLQSIVTHGPNDRILTVLTCRSEYETPWGSHPNQSQIALRPLSRQHISEILQTQNENSPPADDFLQRVKKITKGIPSLVEGVRDGIIPV